MKVSIFLGFAALVFIGLAVPAPLRSETLSGPARIIDGDTLVIDGQTIRLAGIDAPALDQICRWEDRVVRCGVLARDALKDLSVASRVTCARTGTGSGIILAWCRANGYDLSEGMIHTGWARLIPGSTRYAAILKKAQAAKRGIWRGAPPESPK